MINNNLNHYMIAIADEDIGNMSRFERALEKYLSKEGSFRTTLDISEFIGNPFSEIPIKGDCSLEMITLKNGVTFIYRRYTFDRSDSGFDYPTRHIYFYIAATEEYVRKVKDIIEKMLVRNVYTEQINGALYEGIKII